jgi:DNA-binding transcriptional regulator YhcF (GntR family)
MKNNLNDYEVSLMDQFLNGGGINDAKSIQIAIRNFITEKKEQIMQERSLDERDFRAFHTQTVNNLFQFLKDNEFVAEREGNVVFMTEKGKSLRKQGSVAKYAEWQKETRAKNKVIIHTIETRGYLDQDEIIRNRRALIIKRIKKFVVYPILLLILIFFLLIGAHKYNLDKDVPFIRNMFNKAEQRAKEADNAEQNTDKKHKKKH